MKDENEKRGQERLTKRIQENELKKWTAQKLELHSVNFTMKTMNNKR